MFYAPCLKHGPWSISDPRNSSVPYRVQLVLSQILWLLANPLWTHGIGESRCKNAFRLLVGVSVTNQILWFYTNPFIGSLLRPKCKIKLLTHHILLMCIFVRWVQQLPITSCGYTNPNAGSLSHPNRLSKQHVFIKRHLIPHNKIGSTGQLIGKSLSCYSAVGFSHFFLIKSLGFGNISFGKMSCFNISPC